MKTSFCCLLLITLFTTAFAQKQAVVAFNKPKLIVGIVVDQMRWDFLYRYAGRYSTIGFKRIMNEGFSCENTFIPYTPTYTGPGHACVYTGSVPAINGIIGNNWYRRDLAKDVYCIADTFNTVGSASAAGKVSPANLSATTIGDELRLATNFRSKVIGISLKDRAAVLPAGHAGAAYWFDNATGYFITSTYYRGMLPDWLNTFNNRKLADKYLQQNWNTLYPLNTYKQSSDDNKSYEGSIPGEDNSFPHNTSSITKDKYNALRYTPYGNTLLLELAKAAIEGDQLGMSSQTDMLSISFSSTDYIGHTFGPNSVEAEDAYLRLDSDIASLLTYLDGKFGKGEYLVFLTADHGAAHVPSFLEEHNIPAGQFAEDTLATVLNDALNKQLKISNAVERVINEQVYLNRHLTDAEEQSVKAAVIARLLQFPAIANAIDLSALSSASIPSDIKTRLINGYNQKLSGDIQFIFKPAVMGEGGKGTTHGAWNPYDSHIPLLWYGWGVRRGKLFRETYMTDIAATVAAMLHIQMPSGCIGKVIEEVLK